MGEVYHGWDPALNRPAAVKMIRPHLPGEAAGSRLTDRFRREGRLLAGLKHPNIVAVYDAGVHDGRPYLAMEFVPGGSLADRKAALTAAGPAAIAPVVEKVARGVHAAHARGVMHRDLKPGNILMSADDEPLVADFGLAKLFAPDDPPATAAEDTPLGPVTDDATVTAGPQPGTPGYMAPEQAAPGGAAGPAADVYALGVILYELLTGARPFPPTGPTGPAPPVTGPTAAHRRLGAVAARCLEADAGCRYDSAAAVADAVRRAARPPRRWPWAAALAVLAAGAAAVAVKVWSPAPVGDTTVEPAEFAGYTDPAATRDALDRLARGEAVDLIAGGPPKSYRLNLGPASGRLFADKKATCFVHANEYCLVELLPRLPPGEWVVEARLRQDTGYTSSNAIGIFAAATRGPGPEGEQNLFLALTHNPTRTLPDIPEGTGSSVVLVQMIHESATQVHVPPGDLVVPPRWTPTPEVLSLTVGPEGVTPAAGDHAFPRCGRERFDEKRRAIYAKFPRLTAAGELPARLDGGVGVYGRQALIAVDRFTVRPRK